jgi:hypothetical protein
VSYILNQLEYETVGGKPSLSLKGLLGRAALAILPVYMAGRCAAAINCGVCELMQGVSLRTAIVNVTNDVRNNPFSLKAGTAREILGDPNLKPLSDYYGVTVEGMSLVGAFGRLGTQVTVLALFFFPQLKRLINNRKNNQVNVVTDATDAAEATSLSKVA